MKPIVDISKWQGNINADVMVPKVSGVIARASHGEWPDRLFSQNYDKLTKRTRLGAYHYWKPAVDSQSQVKMFASQLDGKSFQLPIFVDVEDTPAVNAPKTLAANLREFIERLKLARPFDEIGIYTRASYWDYYLKSAAPWAANFKLWVAHYTGASSPIVPGPWKPDNWYLWQYSADGNGKGPEYGVQSTAIDLNRMNPHHADQPDQPDPLPVPTQPLPRLRVIRPVNVRREPRLLSERLATLGYGDIIDVKQIHIATAWQCWVEHNGGWSAATYNGIKFMEGVK